MRSPVPRPAPGRPGVTRSSRSRACPTRCRVRSTGSSSSARAEGHADEPGRRPGRRRRLRHPRWPRTSAAEVGLRGPHGVVGRGGAPVLVYGESGTGKELVARTIHERSNRRQGPFVAINCAAIPETLIESEIFGHERGAFTGAIERRLGCFELADRGTLFLDEIAEMEVSVQAKLLRILQDNAFRRVGGREELHVDVRIIAATNRAPADALAAGKLREDLFYRLNVFPIPLPPLRQRPEDILPLARTFIEEFCAENARHVVALAPEAEKPLLDYAWPGNVRELRNAVQRAVVLGEGALLTAEHLAPAILATSRPTPTAAAPRTGERIRDMERRLIVETLEHVNHDKTRAAVLLGISPKTLYNKIARYKIRSVKRSDAT